MEMVVVDEDTVDLQDVFLAASENGCIVSRTQGCSRVAETPWKTAVPYGLVSVDISSTRIP